MTTQQTQTPPGWYPDPVDPASHRWFDGTRWTPHARPVVATAPPVPAAPQLTPGPGARSPQDGQARPSLYATPFLVGPHTQIAPGPTTVSAAPSGQAHPQTQSGDSTIDPLLVAPTSTVRVPAQAVVERSKRAWRTLRPHKPSGRKAGRRVGTVLVLIAFSVLGYGVWESVGTTMYADRAQESLKDDFAAAMAAAPAPAVQAPEPAAPDEPYVAPTPPEHPPTMPAVGEVAGRIIIPKIGVDRIVQVGTTTALMRKGPGVWTDGVFPGAPGNATVSGHRTTYGAPFRDIDQLTTGDRITWEAPGHLPAVFEVRGKDIVSPKDVTVTRQGGGVRLTLTSCDPPGSAARRLVVQAELVEGEFAALALPASEWQFIR